LVISCPEEKGNPEKDARSGLTYAVSFRQGGFFFLLREKSVIVPERILREFLFWKTRSATPAGIVT
jgi:hypothetical protein